MSVVASCSRPPRPAIPSGQGSTHLGLTKRNLLLTVPATTLLALSSQPPPAHASLFSPSPKAAFATLVQTELGKVVTSADVADLTRLMLAEAATYDVSSDTGGFDGSIFLCEDEAARYPELKDIRGRLRAAKASIDAVSSVGPVTYADLISLAVKTAVGKQWFEYRIARAGGDVGKATTMDKAYGTPWAATVGRADAAGCPPSGPGAATLPPRDAPPAEVYDFFQRLGNAEYGKPRGRFDRRPPFFSECVRYEGSPLQRVSS